MLLIERGTPARFLSLILARVKLFSSNQHISFDYLSLVIQVLAVFTADTEYTPPDIAL